MPSPRPAHAQHLIGFRECVQDGAEDGRVHHCRRVEAQPGKVHGNLHTEIVADLICTGGWVGRGLRSALPSSWDSCTPPGPGHT